MGRRSRSSRAGRSRCTPRSASSRASRRRCTGAAGRSAISTSRSCPTASGGPPGRACAAGTASSSSRFGRRRAGRRRRQVERMLSLDVDGAGFPEVGERDPAIGRLQARYPGLRPVSFPSPFEAGAWFVLSQRIRAAQARRAQGAPHRRARRARGDLRRGAPRLPRARGGRRARRPRRPARAQARDAARARAGGRSRVRSTASACARWAATPRSRSSSACPGVGPFTAQGIVVRGAGEPDYLATAEPRMARAAALAYGLDAPLRARRAGPPRARPGARTARGCGVLLRLGLAGRVARARAAFEPHWRGGERPRACARADAERPRPPLARALGARYPRSCRPGSRGGRDNPSRKVRTPQGKVVGRPTRGNPRESATETHRRWRGPCRAPHRQG